MMPIHRKALRSGATRRACTVRTVIAPTARPRPAAFIQPRPLVPARPAGDLGGVSVSDYGLVIPDENKSLREGRGASLQTESYKGMPGGPGKTREEARHQLDRPWRELSQEERQWVIDGEGPWEKGYWYGIKRYFEWLESRAYKMHVRVLLSRYRAYTPCDVCGGARLCTYGVLWRVGSHALAEATLAGRPRFRPQGVQWTPETLTACRACVCMI